MTHDKKRCAWVTAEKIYIDYHDNEWGQPTYDDQRLFEFLILEGAQAGLSWITILKKRDNYRAAFDEFSPQKIACYNKKKIDALLTNPGIIRNRLKIESVVTNARAYLNILATHTRFSEYIWQFVDGQPILNHWQRPEHVPTSTSLSSNMAKDLKQQGFKFVGTTICYAYMQAVGMVNDHLTRCYKHLS